jgi:hypothetical protein
VPQSYGVLFGGTRCFYIIFRTSSLHFHDYRCPVAISTKEYLTSHACPTLVIRFVIKGSTTSEWRLGANTLHRLHIRTQRSSN